VTPALTKGSLFSRGECNGTDLAITQFAKSFYQASAAAPAAENFSEKFFSPIWSPIHCLPRLVYCTPTCIEACIAVDRAAEGSATDFDNGRFFKARKLVVIGTIFSLAGGSLPPLPVFASCCC
jgi:hypothetical protein